MTIQETNENESLMRCRNRKEDVKTRFQALIWDKSKGRSAYRLDGIRHKGGVTCMEAFIWNMGSCRLNAKGKLKWRTHKSESTDVRHSGGPAGSSVEAAVMAVERSGWLIEQTGIKQLNLIRRI